MEHYLLSLILAGTTIVLSLMLVSKKQHCYAVNHLAIIMLFFACMISIQPMGIYNQSFSFFCGLTMMLCLGVFFWDRFGGKRRYFVKDIDLAQADHLRGMQTVLRDYVRQQLPLTARVDLTYRVLTIAGATEEQRQGCIRVINQYMNEHYCNDTKDWRFMIIVAASVLTIAMVLQAVYYYFNGFPA